MDNPLPKTLGQPPQNRRHVLGAARSWALGSLLLPWMDLQAQPSASVSRPTTPGAPSRRSWLQGGTRAMQGKYPDPFTAGSDHSACLLYPTSLVGPCRSATIERRDISDGWDGLPVRLALQLLDRSCQPLRGASVEIWHTASNGLYSGRDIAWMCHGGNSDARANRWFRGIQVSDARGRVDFDSCYPGWYPGRAVHIHFAIRLQGKDIFASQLYFPEDISLAILTEHPSYRSRGKADTDNRGDFLFKGDGMQPHLMETKWMTDGALHAWKSIMLAV